jgi:hypothetical protein
MHRSGTDVPHYGRVRCPARSYVVLIFSPGGLERPGPGSARDRRMAFPRSAVLPCEIRETRHFVLDGAPARAVSSSPAKRHLRKAPMRRYSFTSPLVIQRLVTNRGFKEH